MTAVMQRQNGGTAGTAEVDRLLLELEKNLEGAKLSLQREMSHFVHSCPC